MKSLAAAQVAALHRLRNRFGVQAAAEKAALLNECAARGLTNPRVVLRYHEALLFMAAYPDSRRHAALVDAELARIEAAAPAFFRQRRAMNALEESGLAGEPIETGLSIAMIEWLMEKFPGQIRLAWQNGATGADLDDVLSCSLLPAERDGRLLARFDMQRWLRFAAGVDSTDQRDLQWALARLRDVVPNPELCDLVSEWVDVCICWRIPSPGPSRTTLRFPARRTYMQRGDLKRSFDVKRLLRRLLPHAEKLTRSDSRELIDIARSALVVRQRETDPVTYANPREVTRFMLDRGIDIMLFGIEPMRRLPIESYIGYVAARNRVPVAYGGAWITDHHAEIGVHLFDTFRGGESAYLFGQVLRTYARFYSITRFEVDPYQFGDGNQDAIRSGAFWFYYRFGFRPRDESLREIAEAEWKNIRRNRSYRTSPAVLRRFTKSPLVLELDAKTAGCYRPDLTRIGVAVTEAIRARFGDDRAKAQRWAVRRVVRMLAVGRRDRWSEGERFAFDRLCPLVAVLPGVETWPAADRRALASLMRSKGGPRERDFIFRMQRHARLRQALAECESSIDWTQLPKRPKWRAEPGQGST